jgi:hydroxymethylglutaryl-CoA lyase
MSERAYLREVGLRDGLQLVRGDLSTAHKLEWIRQEAAAGVAEIEVTSFVPFKSFPIFADAAEVAQAALQIPGLLASGLTPNARGAHAAFETGLAKVNYVISASEAHSQANVRRSTAEAMADFARIVAARAERGLEKTVTLSFGIATCFGCTIQGHVDEDLVYRIAEGGVALGADEVMIADTVGYAHPLQVERIFAGVLARLGHVPVAAHFHDTRGLGLANIAAAARVGVRRFDASLGGLGGCPHAPGATGNVVFEDAAYLLETMGLSTGIDIPALIALRRQVETWLAQERFAGSIARAGLPKNYRPAATTA